MKVRLTLEFDERCRRALAHHYGHKQPATRTTIRSWIATIVDATMAHITSEYDNDNATKEKEPTP